MKTVHQIKLDNSRSRRLAKCPERLFFWYFSNDEAKWISKSTIFGMRK